MKPMLTLAQCGCRFDEYGTLASTCAGHRETRTPPAVQKARRLADVTPISRRRRFLHALARMWRR
jgi:hypothetical protein